MIFYFLFSFKRRSGFIKKSATFSKPDLFQLSDSGGIGLLLIVIARLLNSLRVKSSKNTFDVNFNKVITKLSADLNEN